METQALKPQLRMLLPSLEQLPPLDLPAGYESRSFREGDGRHWEHIIDASFGGGPGGRTFASTMRADEAFAPERIWFVLHAGEPVATASAYHRPRELPHAGMLHYVGVLPGHTGKRLGYWVSLAALWRMRREQRSAAWLQTDDFRLPAVKTYLRLGFQPLLVHENQRARWQRVFADLGLPQLRQRFAAILEGELHANA